MHAMCLFRYVSISCARMHACYVSLYVSIYVWQEYSRRTHIDTLVLIRVYMCVRMHACYMSLYVSIYVLALLHRDVHVRVQSVYACL
jgi:hypothetical protein